MIEHNGTGEQLQSPEVEEKCRGDKSSPVVNIHQEANRNLYIKLCLLN